MPEPLTIRWDGGMGCYRVNQPNFAEDGPVRVFREEDVRRLYEGARSDDVSEFLGALDAFPAPEEWTA